MVCPKALLLIELSNWVLLSYKFCNAKVCCCCFLTSRGGRTETIDSWKLAGERKFFFSTPLLRRFDTEKKFENNVLVTPAKNLHVFIKGLLDPEHETEFWRFSIWCDKIFKVYFSSTMIIISLLLRVNILKLLKVVISNSTKIGMNYTIVVFNTFSRHLAFYV